VVDRAAHLSTVGLGLLQPAANAVIGVAMRQVAF
jgi:hypothetical protein